METARGTIIRLTKLTESSLIVHWLTHEYGLIKTVAKSARRAKSQFAGQLDLFIDAEIQWRRSNKSELHRLDEVQVRDHRYSIRKSYRDAVAAGYFSQLLEMVLEVDHPEPEMYDLLQRGLSWLQAKKVDLKGVVYFEKEVGRLLGLGNTGFQGLVGVYGNMPKCRDHCLDLLK